MKNSVKIILGLLLFASGLYASEVVVYTEDDAEELGRLALQTPEQTAQAYKLMLQVSYFKDKDKVKLEDLLASKADVRARTSGNSSILHWVHYDNPEIVQLLLKYKAPVNSKNKHARTPLNICLAGAADYDDETRQSLLVLLEHGAHINAKDDLGNTPLRELEPVLMLDYGSKENYIPLLLEWGADPNIVNKDSETMLDSLHNKLKSMEYSELRPPLCKAILHLDAHRKRIDCIDESLQQMSKDVVGIIVEYECGKHKANPEKLDALLKDFDGLIKKLREDGELE